MSRTRMDDEKRSPEQLLDLKWKMLKRAYHTESLMNTLGLSKEKILFSSQGLPPGIKRSAYYQAPQGRNGIPEQAQKILAALKEKDFHDEGWLATKHREVVILCGEKSHIECLFIRYAREFFRRKVIR